MSVAMSIAVYFIIWWIALFTVLPFGIRTQGESGIVVPGTPESAPTVTRLVRVFAINTVLSFFIFGIVWAVIASGIVSYRDADSSPNAPVTGRVK